MAHRQIQLLAAVAAAVACLAPLAFATVYIVGDHDCWGSKFNGTAWTADKTFFVNDTLMFVYAKESHTVAQVGKEDFAACNLDGNMIGGVMNTGYDVVQLQKPGKMWFICTKPTHCLNGMKLAINVVDAPASPPSSAPPAVGYTVGSAAVAVVFAAAVAVLAF